MAAAYGTRLNPAPIPVNQAYGSQIDGISAVNPAEPADYQPFIDEAYGAWESRANPVFAQQQAAFDQRMSNQGIPVGSEAYNDAWNQMGMTQNDARQQATFGSMGFGMDAQGQAWDQDFGRSQLANALLQAQMQTDLGYYDTSARTGLGYAELAQQNSQFGQNLDFLRDELADRTDLGWGELGLGWGGLGLDYDRLAQQGYEFDQGLDYDYWNTGSKFDYMYDRAGMQDLQWYAGQDRQDYYDQESANQYQDALLMQMLGLGGTPGVAALDPRSAYSDQIGSMTNQYGSNMDFLNNLFSYGG